MDNQIPDTVAIFVASMQPNVTRRKVLQTVGASAALSATAGCLGLTGGNTPEIAVSSKSFTEQFILAYMSIEKLEAEGYTVTDQTGLGGSPANWQALKNDEVQMFWEYTGTAWVNIMDRDEKLSDPETLYTRIDDHFNDEFNIDWLNRGDFNSTYVIVANPDWASENGLETLTDVAEYVNSGNTEFSVGMNPEIEQREDAWAGLPDTYGFADGAADLEVVNMGLGVVYEAAAERQVEMAFGFPPYNPNIEEFGLTTLDDVENHFQIYNPAPLVRNDVFDQSMKSTLNEVPNALDAQTMGELTGRVSLDDQDPQQVARDFLEAEGLI
jgi:osmoprotectant transport system substrate-binding protein